MLRKRGQLRLVLWVLGDALFDCGEVVRPFCFVQVFSDGRGDDGFEAVVEMFFVESRYAQDGVVWAVEVSDLWLCGVEKCIVGVWCSFCFVRVYQQLIQSFS